jgi:hypothetical protein
MKSSNLWMPLVSLAMITGCNVAMPTDDGSVVGDTDARVSENHKKSPNGFGNNGFGNNGFGNNGFGNNGLVPGGIGDNALDFDSMNDNTMARIVDPSPDGDVAREFVYYLVACALDSSQSLSFSWTDADGAVHDEKYDGHLGLAPNWASEPLDSAGQKWVSACMAAHVNYYAAHVMISLRSAKDPLRLQVLDSELREYNRIEGAFWGNMWGDDPHIYTCYNPDTVDYSRSQLRDCAAGHVNEDGSIEECVRIEIVGPCDEACVAFNPASQYYTKCAGDSVSSFVITTALH